MKKSDIAMIILIASVSMLIAYFVARAIFGDAYTGNAQVKAAEPISSEVVEPNTEIFNEDAINPAVPVRIGEDGTIEIDSEASQESSTQDDTE
jgi:hypothetical protein